MRGLTKFEVIAGLLGMLGGATIGVLWYTDSTVLASVPTPQELAYSLKRMAPWTRYLTASVIQQCIRSPALAGTGLLLVIIAFVRSLARFFESSTDNGMR